MNIQRGGLYWANLEPQSKSFRSEPGKTRPVVVVQTDALNQSGHPSTIICPLTTHIQRKASVLRVWVPKSAGLEQESEILVDQLRAIDNRRLLSPIGKLPTVQMISLIKNIKIVLDIGWA